MKTWSVFVNLFIFCCAGVAADHDRCCGHVRFVDGERSAKSAALVHAGGLNPIDVGDQIHDLADFVVPRHHRFAGTAQPQFSQPVTALMK